MTLIHVNEGLLARCILHGTSMRHGDASYASASHPTRGARTLPSLHSGAATLDFKIRAKPPILCDLASKAFQSLYAYSVRMKVFTCQQALARRGPSRQIALQICGLAGLLLRSLPSIKVPRTVRPLATRVCLELDGYARDTRDEGWLPM